MAFQDLYTLIKYHIVQKTEDVCMVTLPLLFPSTYFTLDLSNDLDSLGGLFGAVLHGKLMHVLETNYSYKTVIVVGYPLRS